MQRLKSKPLTLLFFLILVLFLTSFTPLVVPVKVASNTSSHIVNGHELKSDLKKIRHSSEKKLRKKVSIKNLIFLNLFNKYSKKIENKKSIYLDSNTVQMNRKAIFAIIFSSVTLLFLLLSFLEPIFLIAAGVAAIGALIFGVLGIKETNENSDQRGKGWSWFSLIIGSLTICIGIVVLILYLVGYGW